MAWLFLGNLLAGCRPCVSGAPVVEYCLQAGDLRCQTLATPTSAPAALSGRWQHYVCNDLTIVADGCDPRQGCDEWRYYERDTGVLVGAATYAGDRRCPWKYYGDAWKVDWCKDDPICMCAPSPTDSGYYRPTASTQYRSRATEDCGW